MADSRPLSLPRRGTKPLYQQIKGAIQHRIDREQWRAGDQLPSENELVQSLGISRMTINRALRELTHEGVLERRHGVGTFVAETPRHASLIELQDIAEEIGRAGRKHRCDPLRLEQVPADRQTRAAMALDEGIEVFYLEALHHQDDTPVQLEERYVNPGLAPEFLAMDFRRITATRYLMELFRPDEMEHVVRAVRPDATTARRLQIARTEPCLQLRRRTWKGARVVTLAVMTWPGSRYDLSARYATDAYSKR